MKGYLHKQGKYWYLLIDIGKDPRTGKRIRRNINTKCEKKSDARKVQAEILTELNKGHFIDKNSIAFSEYMLKWLEDYAKINCETTTYEGYRIIIESHIVPYFKDLKLQELRPAHIQQYYDYLVREGRKDGKGGLSASTIKRHHANIRKALDRAVMLQLIPNNPALSVELPKVTKFKGKAYNIEQLKQLIEVSKGGPIHTAIMLASGLGLRRGEVCGLKWSHIDFEKGIVKIENTRTANGGVEVEKSTKTEKSNRTLSLPNYLKEYLKDLYKRQQKMKLLCGKGYNNSDYVCCWDDGTPVRPDYISKKFKEIIDKNSLPPIRFHDLRHTNATLLLEQNVNIKWLSDWLGHSTIRTTADIYAHVTDKVLDEVANKMDEVFSFSTLNR